MFDACWSVGMGSGLADGTCEQADLTWSRTASGVWERNWTTASCWPNVASKELQPTAPRVSRTADIPAASPRLAQRAGRAGTPAPIGEGGTPPMGWNRVT